MKHTILIADDDKALVETIRTRLEFEGFKTLTAHEGIRVIEHARKDKPDLIILDIKMPAGSGTFVLEDLLKLDETRDIPIIILTGLDDSDLEEKSYKLGAKAFIKKPCDLDKLTHKIKSLLGES